MKRKFLCFAAIAAIAGTAIACRKNDDFHVGKTNSEKVDICLQAMSDGIAIDTKAASAEDEISSVEFFVFNSDGSLDVAKSATGTSSTLSVTAGKGKLIYAVVNPQNSLVSSYSSASELEKAQDSILASAATLEHIGMAGKLAPMDITATTAGPVNVSVDRNVSKIRLEKITNNLNSSFGEMKIKKIFLSNVTASMYYFKSDCSSTWINQRGRSISDKSFLTKSGLNVTISSGNSSSTEYSFYCYPNPTTTDSTSETWCPRHTRLVIEAEINGQTYYYPISLNEHIAGNKIEKNKIYTIKNLTINHLGSSDPDIPVTSGDLVFSVSVIPWTSVDLDTVVM